MAKAWIYQDDKQVKKHGEEKASWYVGWLDPAGKRRCRSCGPGESGHRNAKKLKSKVEAELLTGTYQSTKNKTWADFREEFYQRVLCLASEQTRRLTLNAMDSFARLMKPVKVLGVTTQMVDRYVAARRLERGKKKKSQVSVATVNKELRHLRAALRVAVDWDYLEALPRFKMAREAQKLPTYVTGDDFALLYVGCENAQLPADVPNVSPSDWWRALLVTGYMTGWRVNEILSLRRTDLDFENGTAITRAEDNKGRRDERVVLHPVVLEHLKKLAGFDPLLFPWRNHQRMLWTEFARIQEAAGIHLPCEDDHQHTRYCHVYGFHDLRRAFATMNADKLTADALQALMRHKSYLTTQKYINMARQMDTAVAALHVPEVLKPRNSKPERGG
jgi:integrase